LSRHEGNGVRGGWTAGFVRKEGCSMEQIFDGTDEGFASRGFVSQGFVSELSSILR
jgi:hypothetical protein